MISIGVICYSLFLLFVAFKKISHEESSPKYKYSSDKIGQFILTGITALPIVSLVLLYSSVLHTRLVFGHWPSYGNPDPGDSKGLLLIHDIITTYIYIAVYLGSFVFAVFIAGELIRRKKEFLFHFACLIFIYGIWWFHHISDPGRFIDWIFD